MADLPRFAAEVLVACRQRAAALLETLGQAFEWPQGASPGQTAVVAFGEASSQLSEPGIALELETAEMTLTILATAVSAEAASRLVGEGEAPTGRRTQLQQSLVALLWPDHATTPEMRVSRADRLAQVLTAADAAEQTSLVCLEVSGLPHPSRVLIGALPRQGEVASTASESSGRPAGDQQPETAAAAPPQSPSSGHTNREDSLQLLPEYTRSLLRIKLPVTVTLASTAHPVQRILEMGPGSIIQFDKSCEETLVLEIGSREIAVGEAVKVGEKFGLRITSMIMPKERFHPVRGAAPGAT